MKKTILSVAVLASTFAMAQTGKVGVNTTTPVRTLDVEGDLRVKTLGDGTAAPYSNVLVQNPATGLVDALPVALIKDGSANEPWFVQTTNIPATGNTQNIYQMGKVAVGGSSNYTGSQMDVFGPGTPGNRFGAQLVLRDTGNTNPILGFNVTNIYASYIGVDRASGKLYITNAHGSATNNSLTNGAFVLDSSGKIGLGFGNPTPTETLDVNGNARIRGLVNGSDVTNFPYNIVAKANGTLGYSTRAEITKPVEKILVTVSDPPVVTAYLETEYYPTVIGLYNTTSAANPLNIEWWFTSGKWTYDVHGISDNTDIGQIQVIWVKK